MILTSNKRGRHVCKNVLPCTSTLKRPHHLRSSTGDSTSSIAVPCLQLSTALPRVAAPHLSIGFRVAPNMKPKPLKLFRLIVLKLIYIYIQYIKSYSYRYTYIYISSMKGHSWTTHRWIIKKSKKVHLASLSSLTIRISLGCEQPRWENTTSVFSRCDGSSHRLAARPHTSI